MFKLVLEKAEEPEIKLPTSAGSWKKQESSRKTSISALLTMPNPLTVYITITQSQSRLQGEISNLRYADDTTLMPESEELKSLLMNMKEESEEVGLKLNIFQARLKQYVNRELPHVQAGFRKGRGTRDQIANMH